jgi:hypothetical protein
MCVVYSVGARDRWQPWEVRCGEQRNSLLCLKAAKKAKQCMSWILYANTASGTGVVHPSLVQVLTPVFGDQIT